MNANTSPSEARNLMGLLTSTINKIKKDRRKINSFIIFSIFFQEW
jgi:hypothetical protein